MLRNIWRVEAWVELYFACGTLLFAMVLLYQRRGDWATFVAISAANDINLHLLVFDWSLHATLHVLGAIIAFTPSIRLKLHAILSARSEAVAAAVAVSTLIGSHGISEVQALAQRNFHRIWWKSLRKGHILNNAPDPSVFDLSEPAELGTVDAFVSHSWHDDPVLKWDALEAWAEQFHAVHKRHPALWLDK